MFEVARRNPEAAAGVRPEWRRIVQSAEELLGRSWDEMAHRHGDWRWDGTMAAATRPLGWRLVEGVREVGAFPTRRQPREYAGSGSAWRSRPGCTLSLRACECQLSMSDPIATFLYMLTRVGSIGPSRRRVWKQTKCVDILMEISRSLSARHGGEDSEYVVGQASNTVRPKHHTCSTGIITATSTYD
jgi:hypothetical protein